jgi:8-oxo-dGTP diphosphatase
MVKVVCAIIFNRSRILAAQRSALMELPFKWEFPGGKLEDIETEENCILREINEELNIQVQLISRMQEVNYQYPDKNILLVPFVARYLSGDITLAEHTKYGWFTKNELLNLDFAPADIPVLNNLMYSLNADLIKMEL